jgi:peptide subunit release factor 1 (eRF1)
MTNEEILREINSLPIEAQRQIEDFVAFLSQRYKSSSRAETAKTDLSAEEFIGMWRDREDMQDSTNWVRSVRGSHWGK